MNVFLALQQILIAKSRVDCILKINETSKELCVIDVDIQIEEIEIEEEV